MSILYIILTFISFSVLLLFLTFCFLILRIFTGKSIRNPIYPPVKGTVFDQLFYFNRLYDYQTEIAKEHPTVRFLAPEQSEVYTTNTRNIEHVLKTNFSKYSKGKYNQDIVSDIFGQGIFVVDGEKWKQQRKLASFEFSTRVLRDFSCSVFRRNAAKLVRAVFEISGATKSFDMQDILMRCTLDSIFKVGFGIDLNCLEGSSKEGTAFMKAFDDSTALAYWRYVDPFWKLKRFLNIGSEATLRKNVKVIDDFVHQLIRSKRKLLAGQKDPDGRCAEIDDILPDGFRLKKGDGIYYMAYAMGRMPYIWGEDAEDFRPERWLKNGVFQPESPFKFVAFHAGPRICLGKDFAYRQMKIVSTALLSFFRFKLADETKTVTYKTMFTLHMDGGLPLRAVARTASTLLTFEAK
ncbi:hypothetical protein GBA52_007595 [Prunus armeniaca]|nr:hypothetical protein GBA52_007595 [Prunus armeniaca]